MSGFAGQENKRVLWGILYEGGVFNHIDAGQLDKVKHIFEEQVAYINTTHSGTVMEMNKEAMRAIVNKLEPLKTRAEEVPRPAGQAQVKEQRALEFDNSLKSRQEEFTGLINAAKPQRIDFSDGTEDKPIGSEMDRLLAEATARRERELSMVVSSQDVKAGEEWIGTTHGPAQQTPNGSTQPTPHGQPIAISSTNVSLQIEEVQESQHPPKKKVTFEDVSAGPSDAMDLSSFLGAITSQPPPPPSVPPPVPDYAPSVEDRLARLEEKMDALLGMVKALGTG
jgi:hypothetical protein